MSVLIKGMEMPKSCYKCPLRRRDGMDIVCPVAHERFSVADVNILGYRLDNCPLVPVPPHGRLIEDVAVREQIDEWLDSVGDVVVGHGLSYYGELLGCIEDAPTIIPAEEGET